MMTQSLLMHNDYEFDLGHFRGAIRPNITRFRDLPDWIKRE